MGGDDSQNGKIEPPVHPIWAHWIKESCYTHAQARDALGLPNGTFYRRIAREPGPVDRLAMSALYEGLEPFSLDYET